jgi:hypothetical protein
MGKSLRSKTKRAYRHKKREDSDYAVNEAARLARLSAKLASVAGIQGKDEEEMIDHDAEGDEGAVENVNGGVEEQGMCALHSSILHIYRTGKT